jgi:hypothetical protein
MGADGNLESGMGIIDRTLASWSPGALSMLRVVGAYLYLQHGTAKLLRAAAGGGSWSIDALRARK